MSIWLPQVISTPDLHLQHIPAVVYRRCMLCFFIIDDFGSSSNDISWVLSVVWLHDPSFPLVSTSLGVLRPPTFSRFTWKGKRQRERDLQPKIDFDLFCKMCFVHGLTKLYFLRWIVIESYELVGKDCFVIFERQFHWLKYIFRFHRCEVAAGRAFDTQDNIDTSRFYIEMGGAQVRLQF